MAEKTRKKDKGKKELLIRIRKRFQIMVEADRENRQLAMDDLKFLNIPGEQWDATTRKERGTRPCYEFNKLRVSAKRVINDMRANRPAGKVSGTEDGDKETAETIEGLGRNIWNVSDADTVIDNAAEYQVGGGMGNWRVTTEWGDDDFTQDIKVEAIKNPFCLYADPSAKDPMKRDAADWILTERISRSTFEAKYPDAEAIDFEESEFDDEEDWADEETVRICEYWYKEPVIKEIWLLKDGKVVDAETDGAKVDPTQVAKRRKVKTHNIKMCVASGDSILETPKEEGVETDAWKGKNHPFVQVYGESIVIDGKTYWWGLTRPGKDAQRSYNASRTAITETIALAPQSKWWATANQAKGHVDKWSVAHKENMPFMLYTADANAPGPPIRMGGADVPVALIQESQLASEEIKAVTGIYDASLGAKSNEQSGKAINARQAQGEIATFNYRDNMGKAIRRTWEIIVDLIPKVYDTERMVRILGIDGSEKYVRINEAKVDPNTGKMVMVNDLRRGKFDVSITTGPSFSTQRQEFAELGTQIMQANPEMTPLIGDLIFKAMDIPFSDQIAERLKAMLPPQLQEGPDGKPMPPQAVQAMQQADMAMQQVQEQTKLVQAAAQEVEQGKAELEKGKSEIQKLLSQMDVKEAQFKAEVVQQLAAIEKAATQFEMEQMQSQQEGEKQAVESDKEAFNQVASEAVENIQQLAGQLVDFAGSTIQQLQALASEKAAPRQKSIRIKRVNGELIGDVTDADGSSKQVRVSRQNGELVGQVTPTENMQ